MKEDYLPSRIGYQSQKKSLNSYRLSNGYKAVHSPKSTLKNNIARIDGELYQLKQKMNQIRGDPSNYVTETSFQYISSQSNDVPLNLTIGKLKNESKDKDYQIEGMLENIKTMEDRIRSYQNSNKGLIIKLDEEAQIRQRMEKQLQELNERVSKMNNIHEENFLLKEDNRLMLERIDEKEEKSRSIYSYNHFKQDEELDLEQEHQENEFNSSWTYSKNPIYHQRSGNQRNFNSKYDSYPDMITETEHIIYDDLSESPNNKYKNSKPYNNMKEINYTCCHYLHHHHCHPCLLKESYTDSFRRQYGSRNTNLVNEGNQTSREKQYYNKYNHDYKDMQYNTDMYSLRSNHPEEKSGNLTGRNSKDLYNYYTFHSENERTNLSTDPYNNRKFNAISPRNISVNEKQERPFINYKPQSRVIRSNNPKEKTNNFGINKSKKEKPWIAFKPKQGINNQTKLDNVLQKKIKTLKLNPKLNPKDRCKSSDYSNDESNKNIQSDENTKAYETNDNDEKITKRKQSSAENSRTNENDEKNKKRRKQSPADNKRTYETNDNDVDKKIKKRNQPTVATQEKNKDIKTKIHDIKDQLNNIQQQRKCDNESSNPSVCEMSIDEARKNNKISTDPGQFMKEKEFEKDSDQENNYEHIETNLETISNEKEEINVVNVPQTQVNVVKEPKEQLNVANASQDQVTLLSNTVSKLIESLSITQSEVNTKKQYISTIEQENLLLKDQLNQEKTKLNLEQIKLSNHQRNTSASLSLQHVNQLTFSARFSFFNSPIARDQVQLNSIDNSNVKQTNLFSKLKSKTKMVIGHLSKKTKISPSDNLLFKPYNKKQLLCFDITKYNLFLIDFIDNSNYGATFNKVGIIYLNHQEGLYIITGENNDCLYSYTNDNKAMNKLCNLKNNHSVGGFVEYTKNSTEEKCLLCLSGWYNKKVEEYSTKMNEWAELPETLVERGEASYLVCNNRKVYAFFGYNCPQKKYLNTVEYCSVNTESSNDYKWKLLKYGYQSEPFSLYIKSHSLVSISSSQFVILGGFDGNENQSIDSFIQMMVNETEQSSEVLFSKVNRKLFDIEKNHLYNFTSDFTMLTNKKGMSYQVCYDEAHRVHVINLENMSHDIFYFE